MKRIGFIDARRVNLPGKISIKSWGAILSQGYYQYFNDDYSASIASLATGELDFSVTNGKVNFRCGAHGIAVQITNDGLFTAYEILVTGVVNVINGKLRLTEKSDPVTRQEEGTIYYNTTKKKLEFCTDSAIELVTSA